MFALPLASQLQQFNACVPYTGVCPASAIEEHVLSALVALLPPPPGSGAKAAPPADSDTPTMVLVLQCLQRLVSSTSVAASILGMPLRCHKDVPSGFYCRKQLTCTATQA